MPRGVDPGQSSRVYPRERKALCQAGESFETEDFGNEGIDEFRTVRSPHFQLGSVERARSAEVHKSFGKWCALGLSMKPCPAPGSVFRREVVAEWVWQ